MICWDEVECGGSCVLAAGMNIRPAIVAER